MPMTTPKGSSDPLAAIATELPKLRSEVRLARRSYRFTITVLVTAIAVGGTLFWRQHDAEVERTAAARQYDLDQCKRSNDSRAKLAEAFDTQRDVLIAASAPADGVVSANRQRALNTYNAGIDQLIAGFGPRDCVKLLEEAGR